MTSVSHPPYRRDRRITALGLLAVVAAGLLDRALFGSLLGGAVGDALYAVAVGVFLVLLLPRIGTITAGAVSVLLCAAVEFFQATGIPAALAETIPGTALVLGSGFDVRDLLAYAVGAVLFATADGLRRYAVVAEAPTPRGVRSSGPTA